MKALAVVILLPVLAACTSRPAPPPQTVSGLDLTFVQFKCRILGGETALTWARVDFERASTDIERECIKLFSVH
jgi:hypothetical protein